MVDERYYETIEWQKFIYISYILGILVWSVIVYLIWWKSKDTKTKFSLPTIFSLLIPYFYTAFELWQYKRNPIYPELASCINFKPQSKPFIATQNLKCSLNNLKTTLEFRSGQAGNAFNLTYVLLLLMIMSTAFKFNIFDNYYSNRETTLLKIYLVDFFSLPNLQYNPPALASRIRIKPIAEKTK